MHQNVWHETSIKCTWNSTWFEFLKIRKYIQKKAFGTLYIVLVETNCIPYYPQIRALFIFAVFIFAVLTFAQTMHRQCNSSFLAYYFSLLHENSLFRVVFIFAHLFCAKISTTGNLGIVRYVPMDNYKYPTTFLPPKTPNDGKYIYTYEIAYPSNFTPRFFSRENLEVSCVKQLSCLSSGIHPKPWLAIARQCVLEFGDV